MTTGELKEQNSDTIFQDAVEALRRGDKPRAKELLTLLLKSDQNNAMYWIWLSGVSFFHGTVHAVSDNADFFTFSAVADGFVEAELAGFDPATSNLDLEVLSQNQSLIVRSNSTDSFEIAGFWVQAGRTYYIGVKAISTPGGDQPYSLAIDVN
jgi:hypothetical protein